MLKDKLRRYGIAAAVLFLIFCTASILQHWAYLQHQASAYVSGIVAQIVVLLLVLWVLRLLLGGRRR